MNAVVAAGVDADVQLALLREVSGLLKEAKEALTNLEELDKEAEQKPEGKEQARFFRDAIVPAMEALRIPVDKLEMLVDKSAWPMPSYAELIFEV